MSATPTLFDSVSWVDSYRVGQRVTDGVRTGTITEILADHPGGFRGRGLAVDCDGQRITYGYDHRLEVVP